MFGRDVERVEIVILGFHFRPIQHRKPERREQILNLVLNDGHRVQAARSRTRRGQRKIQPFLLQPNVKRFSRECLLSCFKRACQYLFCGI